MASPRSIHFWRGRAEMREDLAQLLAASGIEVTMVRDLEQLLDDCVRGRVRVVVVDGSAGEREASGRLLEIAHTEALRGVSMLFLSNQALKRITPLRKTFPRLAPVEVSCPAPLIFEIIERSAATGSVSYDDVMELLEAHSFESVAPQSESSQSSSVVDDVVSPGTPDHTAADDALAMQTGSEQAGASTASRSDSPSPVAPGVVIDEESEVSVSVASEADSDTEAQSVSEPTGTEEPVKRKLRKTVESNSLENRQRLQANPDPTNLRGTFGGEHFSIATDASDFHDQYLFSNSSDGKQLHAIVNEMAETDLWAAMQTRRGIFVGLAMARAMSLSSVESELIKTAFAGAHIGFSGPGAGRLLRRYDLIGTPEQDLFDATLTSFRQSADSLRAGISNDSAAELLEQAAAVLSRTPLGVSPARRRLIETFVAIELSMRACWGTGYWNPFGAFRMIRHLRGAQSFLKDDEVRMAICRVLGEAVTSHVTVCNTFQPDIDGDDPLASPARSAMPVRSMAPYIPPPNATTTKVSLSHLTPGMRLAEEIRATDGRMVIDEAVKLNADLVVQIWELAAIRALPAEVRVYLEH